MRRRAAELARRRSALIARSTAQRELMIAEVALIAARLERIDGRIDSVRHFLRRPWLLLGAFGAVALLVGPRKLMRIGARGAMLFGTAQRLLQLVQRVRARAQAHAPVWPELVEEIRSHLSG
jgi:hypothetical protein